MAAPLLYQSLGTRVAILACFWLALLASIPSWLRLTTIQRLPLPKRQVEALQHSNDCPVTFRSNLSIVVDPEILPKTDAARDAYASFLEQVEQLVQQSLDIKAHLPAAASLKCTSWTVEAHSAAVGDSQGSLRPETGAYVVQVASEASAVTSDFKQPWIPTVHLPTTTDDSSSLPIVPDTVSAAVVAELLLLRGDKPLAALDEASSSAIADTEQDPRVIQYSKHVRLVFSIMNQDATDGHAYDSRLIHALAGENTSTDNPITELTRELSSLHDFHVETQVQWFAPLHFQPTTETLEVVEELEVEEEVMVDQEIEEDVDVDVDVQDEDDLQDEDLTPTNGTEQAVLNEADPEAAEVEQQLPPLSRRQFRTVKQLRKRIVQVPRIQRTRKQKRTPLPPQHVVEWDDLKVFVNSQEWSLTSTVPPFSSSNTSIHGRPYDVLSQTHDLHFLLYIPSKSRSPLLIRDPVNGGVEDASGWLIPQWGGVVILNADHGTDQTKGLVGPDQEDRGPVRDLPEVQVKEALTLFSRQLELLLGLSPNALPSHAEQTQRRVQLSTLKQRRILELARESTSTLIAITRLVDHIENLGVGPDVKTDVQSALNLLESLPSTISGQNLNLDALLTQVGQAHALANRAFFNPDMLGLLYFPDEHKYAVYTPLFAPLLVPLFVTTVKLAKELVQRRRAATGTRKARKSARHST